MKSKILLAIFGLLAVVSCNKDEGANFGEMLLSTESLTFAAEQVTAQTVTVSFDGAWMFDISDDADWVSASRDGNGNGNNLSVKVAKNKLKEDRTATITVRSIQSNGPSKVITVTQTALDVEEPLLALDVDEIVFSAYDPDPVLVNIKTAGGVKWACSVIFNGDVFFSFDKQGEDALLFSPAGNNTYGSMVHTVVTFFNTNDRVLVPSIQIPVRQEAVTAN